MEYLFSWLSAFFTDLPLFQCFLVDQMKKTNLLLSYRWSEISPEKWNHKYLHWQIILANTEAHRKNNNIIWAKCKWYKPVQQQQSQHWPRWWGSQTRLGEKDIVSNLSKLHTCTFTSLFQNSEIQGITLQLKLKILCQIFKNIGHFVQCLKKFRSQKFLFLQSAAIFSHKIIIRQEI